MAVFQDQSGRSAGRRALQLRGWAILFALVIAAMFLARTAKTKDEEAFTVNVLANAVDEGLAPGAEVKFHGYTIGSVKTLEPTGPGRQKMTLVIDAGQAGALTTDATARFTSSNVFGTAAVELIGQGHGARLPSGATLRVANDGQDASVVGLLRHSGELLRTFDNADLDKALAVANRHADLTGPVIRAVFDTAEALSKAQSAPLSQSLSVIASFIAGVGDLSSQISALIPVLDAATWLVKPGGAELSHLSLTQVVGDADDAADLIDRNNDWLSSLVTGLVNLIQPVAYSLGSIAPEYAELPGVIDRTGSAFSAVDGRPTLKIEVILGVMPGLGAALPAKQPGSHPIAQGGGK